jgi:predicted nucleic acid-binding protein
MIVVSDTTALTTLIKSGLDWVLPRLFSEILIPTAVADELLQFHPALPEWCVVRALPASILLDRLCQAVDLGEAEAIALAYDQQAALVLLDDKKGRRQAGAIGLTCLALPAVLVAAKRNGLIESVAEAFELIATKGRYRLADSAMQILLRSVGEG